MEKGKVMQMVLAIVLPPKHHGVLHFFGLSHLTICRQLLHGTGFLIVNVKNFCPTISLF